MSSVLIRCVVCNTQAMWYTDGKTHFCSQECETEYNQLMEEIADQQDEEDSEEE